MNSTAIHLFGNLPSTRLGVAWGYIWRGLVASACCGIGGMVVGVTLGLLITLGDGAPHMGSWQEVFVHYSNLFGTLLTTELPV